MLVVGPHPWVRNSDTKVRHGHITKMGPAAVRFVLGEAAHVANYKPPFADAYESIRRRRGKQIATTAVARRLLSAAFYILKEVDESSQLIGVPGELDALSALTSRQPNFLSEQPGPGLSIVMRIPGFVGTRMGDCEISSVL